MSYYDTFKWHSEDWRRDTALMSKTVDKCMNWSYQMIIGMGPIAIQFIMRELENDDIDDWFWALTAITGGDVAQDSDNFQEAAKLWLMWGRENGYAN